MPLIKKYQTNVFGVLFFIFILFFLPHTSEPAKKPVFLNQINLPEGFSIDVYAKRIPNARSLAISPNETLFIGTRTGHVYAAVDEDGDKVAEKRYIVAKNLYKPNGVAFRDGSLYVAESNKILRYDNIEQSLADPPAPVVIHSSLPLEKEHGERYIRFGPDGFLYVSVGAPCNVCERDEPRFATILRMDREGNNVEIFAKGVRHSVGFDWHPITDELWFTDKGREMLGDNVPPDELNYAPTAGMHFGFPYCHGRLFQDPEYGQVRECREFTPAAQELGVQVSSLGMRFYGGDILPTEYLHNIFIAENGLRSQAHNNGYRITSVVFDGNQPVKYEVFADGWVQNGVAWGRPVDLLFMPDNSMLVSDEYTGVIYRISHVSVDQMNDIEKEIDEMFDFD